jgi:membrane-associated phospholipid phosphatase
MTDDDVILFWNHQVNEANRFDHTAPMRGVRQGGPTRSSRATALVHLAMHDAYFGVVQDGTALYLGANAPPPYAGPASIRHYGAAVTAAAQTVLATLYPEQIPSFELAALSWATREGTDERAHEYGRRIAFALLGLRAGDGADAGSPAYVYSLARSRHRADPLNSPQDPLGPSWGRVRLFSSSVFHALAPPPNLGSAAYLNDHREVRAKGGAATQNTTTRSTQETVIGLYWAYDGARGLGTPTRLYNQILRVIAKGRNNTPSQNARLFALVNAAMGDAGVLAWYWKFAYDLWRPVIGIRELDNNFGPDSVPGKSVNADCDPFWRPLGAPKTNDVTLGARSFTPPFPAYPSGHATFGAAAFEMIRLFYGVTQSDAIDDIEFDFISDELNGVSTDNDGALRPFHRRRYTSLAEATYENAVSRVFLGVHWRFDGTSGQSVQEALTPPNPIGGVPLGRSIARDIFQTGLAQSPAGLTPPA